jgi:hypothetical protein
MVINSCCLLIIVVDSFKLKDNCSFTVTDNNIFTFAPKYTTIAASSSTASSFKDMEIESVKYFTTYISQN